MSYYLSPPLQPFMEWQNMRYSQEFKDNVVARLLSKELGISEAVEQYSIGKSTISYWLKIAREQAVCGTLPNKGNPKARSAEAQSIGAKQVLKLHEICPQAKACLRAIRRCRRQSKNYRLSVTGTSLEKLLKIAIELLERLVDMFALFLNPFALTGNRFVHCLDSLCKFLGLRTTCSLAVCHNGSRIESLLEELFAHRTLCRSLRIFLGNHFSIDALHLSVREVKRLR